jgi:intergrase/recombinase
MIDWCGCRDLNPGWKLGRPDENGLLKRKSLEINYLAVRRDFISYIESRNLSCKYIQCILSYLDRYVTVISEPMDVVKAFHGLTDGQQHNLNRAIRNLFKYVEAQGFNKEYLDVLKKNIPKDSTGIDVKIPSEESIIKSLMKLSKVPLKYQALYNLLLDSGLRLVEGVRMINSFKGAEEVNGFYRCELGYFRKSKVAYYAHFSEYTLNKIKDVNEILQEHNASHYFRKYGYVASKYVRKFAFDKMIELDIPESVADFIQGRVARKIGAKHYMALARQSSKFYPKYFEYVTSVRNLSTQV